MVIVDTPFHVTFRSLCDLPTYSCTGRCKKVFWESDVSSEEDRINCLHCGDGVGEAVRNVHYKVLLTSNRNLKFSDFKKYGNVKGAEKNAIKSYLSCNAKILHFSHVKEKFESRAINEWMPNGLDVSVTIGFELEDKSTIDGQKK